MKTVTISVPYDGEKLAALRQYAAKKDVSIEDEITDAIDKLYEKFVPLAVREYIDSKPAEKPARPRKSDKPPSPRP